MTVAVHGIVVIIGGVEPVDHLRVRDESSTKGRVEIVDAGIDDRDGGSLTGDAELVERIGADQAESLEGLQGPTTIGLHPRHLRAQEEFGQTPGRNHGRQGRLQAKAADQIEIAGLGWFR